MAKTSRLAQKQLRALDRIRALPGIEAFHLAGATAIAWHLGHRRSADLDLFSESADVDLDRIRLAASRRASFEVVASGDAVLELEVSDVPVDLVVYPYELLEPPVAGPSGMPTAGLRDLAAMKLSAISRRGIRRDFWDLFAIVSSGLSLAEVGDAYRADESDVRFMYQPGNLDLRPSPVGALDSGTFITRQRPKLHPAEKLMRSCSSLTDGASLSARRSS